MLKIGEFSILFQISIHMLRHYDDIGLLIPEHVDDCTGYRYYSERQLPIANKIQALKSMGLGLALIKEILSKYASNDQLKDYLELHAMEQREKIANMQKQLNLIETTIVNLGHVSDIPLYSVALKKFPAYNVISVRGRIETPEDKRAVPFGLFGQGIKSAVDFPLGVKVILSLEGGAYMLTIGEFSNICKVSAKTLRYYAEIGLILPDEINPENGYRYYSINQLEKVLLINRLKAYCFSLEEIKSIFGSEELMDEVLFAALDKKKKEIAVKVQKFEDTLHQIDNDMSNLRKGKSIMSYMEEIDVQLVEIPMMYLLSIRKNVLEHEFSEEYGTCFGKLFRKMDEKKLTAAAPPMVLFHSDEYSPFGLDTEFAIPIKEYATGTRDFRPGLCLKTVVQGSYSQLPSVYAKQIGWAKREGYENSNALYEVYVTNPAEVSQEKELVTEVYYPVKKRGSKERIDRETL